MARQWLRKSELNEKLWFKGDNVLETSTVAGSYRTALSAESLTKMFLLVVVNSVFLLAALHVLHSRHDFENAATDYRISDNCRFTDRLNNVHDPINTLPTQSSEIRTVLVKSSASTFIPKNSDLSKLHRESSVRQFDTYGVAVHLFIKMSAYRGSPNSFAVIGLEAKSPAELYNDPPYECVWIPGPDSVTWAPVKGMATKMLPDTGNIYSRLYSAVIINCTFAEAVGVDKKGGQLVLYASYGDHYPKPPERIEVLTESVDEFPGVEHYEDSQAQKHDYVYCGSPLFGSLSPQKIREWLAYHARFFGPRSHFFLYDAGGVHDDVRRVIDPWIKAGRVTLDNIREQEKFDGYYHNQFMVVNDCFHRARHLSRWLFFFDVDEYIWAPPHDESLASIVSRYENQSQIIIWQKPMSKSLCAQEESTTNVTHFARKWTFEKLVFKSIKVRESHDCKYAIQGRKAMATGIHRSGYLIGTNATTYADPLNYYHYHNTINKRDEVCEEFIDKNMIYVNPRNRSDLFAYDGGLAVLADRVKEYELDAIGPQPSFAHSFN